MHQSSALRTVLLMNQSLNNHFLSAEYLERFSPAEFKHRWLEALGLETASWKRPCDLCTAFMLASFMIHDVHCFPSLANLVRPMKKSPDPVRRSLRIVSDADRLIIVPRSQKSNLHYAFLPDFGLAKLIKERYRAKQVPHFTQWRSALWDILGPTCSA